MSERIEQQPTEPQLDGVSYSRLALGLGAAVAGVIGVDFITGINVAEQAGAFLRSLPYNR